MKSVLIISPFFPPVNAADMHRIRMSLPYFKEFGWKAEIVTVLNKQVDMVEDCLLTESVPKDTIIHYVNAFAKKWTSKIGLGSLALRSLPFYFRKVNTLLNHNKYDLIYFSTTQFPICVLGPYWKKKYKIPYIIDMQDPWHTEYYKNKSKHERPPKYWFSYRLNKYLEPIAMKQCDGIISVSETYIKDLKARYPILDNKPASVITFGAYFGDLTIVKRNLPKIALAYNKGESLFNLVYIGRGGTDMKKALEILFFAFKRGLEEHAKLFSTFRFNFIGTSYAPSGTGKKTVLPIAEKIGVAKFVFEQTNRVPFYSALASLQEADGLIVPGSDDPGYTASKLYPYIMSKKPLLGVFHPESNAIGILKKCNAGQMITIDEDADTAYEKTLLFFKEVANKHIPQTDWNFFEEHTARKMTEKQVILFDSISK